jgi:hypothetical protein
MNDFEQALRTLTLPASRMDRDRLMFLAGQASVRAVGRIFNPSESEGAGLTGTALTGGKADGLEIRPTRERAGRSASRWFWPAATAVSTACAAVLAVLLVARGGGEASRPQLAEGQGQGQRDSAPVFNAGAADAVPSVAADPRETTGRGAVPRADRPEPAAVFPFAFARTPDVSRLPVYLQLRQLVLERGVDALPSSTSRRGLREPMADAHPAESPWRAIDRPSRSTESGDDLLESILSRGGDKL